MNSFSLLPFWKKVLAVLILSAAILSFSAFFWWKAKNRGLVNAPNAETPSQGEGFTEATPSAGSLSERDIQSEGLDRLMSEPSSKTTDSKQQATELDALRKVSGMQTPSSPEVQLRELDSLSSRKK